MFYTIIAQKDCKPCLDARDLLYAKGEDYIRIYYLTNNSWVLTLMRLAGLKTTPQVFSPDGTLIGGYDDLKKHFKSA